MGNFNSKPYLSRYDSRMNSDVDVEHRKIVERIRKFFVPPIPTGEAVDTCSRELRRILHRLEKHMIAHKHEEGHCAKDFLGAFNERRARDTDFDLIFLDTVRTYNNNMSQRKKSKKKSDRSSSQDKSDFDFERRLQERASSGHVVNKEELDSVITNLKKPLGDMESSRREFAEMRKLMEDLKSQVERNARVDSATQDQTQNNQQDPLGVVKTSRKSPVDASGYSASDSIASPPRKKTSRKSKHKNGGSSFEPNESSESESNGSNADSDCLKNLRNGTAQVHQKYLQKQNTSKKASKAPHAASVATVSDGMSSDGTNNVRGQELPGYYNYPNDPKSLRTEKTPRPTSLDLSGHRNTTTADSNDIPVDGELDGQRPFHRDRAQGNRNDVHRNYTGTMPTSQPSDYTRNANLTNEASSGPSRPTPRAFSERHKEVPPPGPHFKSGRPSQFRDARSPRKASLDASEFGLSYPYEGLETGDPHTAPRDRNRWPKLDQEPRRSGLDRFR